MINLIKVVEILNETKDEMDCGELIPICDLQYRNIDIGYKVYVKDLGKTIQKVYCLSERDLNVRRLPYAVIKYRCEEAIEKLLARVAP